MNRKNKLTEPKENEKKEEKKYNNENCTDDMTFTDCELAILRHAVDQTEEIAKEKMTNSKDIKKMIEIVETFLIKTKCICYGGTAINNILPKEDQFYDREVDIPDYDFFSPTPIAHAKELANIFHKAGYLDVEAKAGIHLGTYKVFVNFIPTADITEIHEELFKSLSKESIRIRGILYAPPNFLRMGMYLELSRPAGDVSRWEKVFKRLTLLNKNYPLITPDSCQSIEFQRNMEKHKDLAETIFFSVRDILIEQEVVFFGGYAIRLYSRYMSKEEGDLVKSIPDFDVLSENPDLCATRVVEHLKDEGIPDVTMIRHDAVGELLPEHIEIRAGDDTIAFIYKPVACHGYNKIPFQGKEIRVATIETILSFYLAFIYTNRPYFNKERLLCMSKFLFEVEQKNRLEQKGLLQRFSITCYGEQPTIQNIRGLKAAKFKELQNDRSNPEHERWFLKYNPAKTKPETRIQERHTRRRFKHLKTEPSLYSSPKVDEIVSSTLTTTPGILNEKRYKKDRRVSFSSTKRYKHPRKKNPVKKGDFLF